MADVPRERELEDLPTDEEERSAEAFVEEMWQSNRALLEDFCHNYPAVPTEPGLHALVAADGVTVGVVAPGVGEEELCQMVRDDVIHRMLRHFFADAAARGRAPEQVSEEVFARVCELKRRYRLEKLG